MNLVTARTLMGVGRRYRSITLEADAQHLMTDVITSIGVIVGVGLVWLTGWLWLDPVIALAVAVNILWTGWQLMRRSTAGLMDVVLPEQERSAIDAVLDRYRAQGLEFHALRTRQAGTRAFVTLHVLVPGRLDRAEGPRLVRAHRGRHSRRGAPRERDHAPRAAGGPGLARRRVARPIGLRDVPPR